MGRNVTASTPTPSTPGWGHLYDSAREVGAVLYDPTESPRRQHMTEARHRRQWPALWETIDELMLSIDALHNEGEGVQRTPTERPSQRERDALARTTDRIQREGTHQ